MATTYLTQEGFNELQAELDHLRKEKRQEVADRLREAADGEDLIENAEYEAAKNEQAFVEGKIQDLENLLAAAKIITEKKYVIQEGLMSRRPISWWAPQKRTPWKVRSPMNHPWAKLWPAMSLATWSPLMPLTANLTLK
jgi:hypothetical protein